MVDQVCRKNFKSITSKNSVHIEIYKPCWKLAGYLFIQTWIDYKLLVFPTGNEHAIYSKLKLPYTYMELMAN